MRLRLTACVLLLTLLSACAGKPTVRQPAPPASWPQHQAQVEAISQWNIRGKFAIFTEDDRIAANLAWQQGEQRYRLTVSNFLGTSLARLDGRPGLVSLSLPEEGTWHDRDPDALLERMTGLQLPVSRLYHWVRGLPGQDEASNLSFTEQGYLAALDVTAPDAPQPWHIEMSNYRSIDGVPLPHNLQLRRGAIRIKLTVIEWLIPKLA